jgi:misacylated tRNA(Ala) deacylase
MLDIYSKRGGGRRMTVALYLQDSYMRECDTTVASIRDERFVVLNQTIFYPQGVGQPHDTGKIISSGTEYNVVFVGKFSGEISHEVDRVGLKPGDHVHCILDWDRRYKLMRSHTAAHVLASIICNKTKALITGNQLSLDKIRFDFNLERFDPDSFLRFVEEANELFKRDIPVKWYELPREEALKIPGIVKMAHAFPPEVSKLRIVEIEDIDKQADGGTHVRNLKEVGRIKFLKAENKGKNNRRIYFALDDTG